MTCGRSVVFSTYKTDHQDITEILLKVALNTINQTEPRWHLFICQSTEHNYTFTKQEYCSWTKTTCVMWGFAITRHLSIICEHFPILFSDCMANWYQTRHESINKILISLWLDKNIANKGILISDLKLLCQLEPKIYMMFWRSSTKIPHFILVRQKHGQYTKKCFHLKLNLQE